MPSRVSKANIWPEETARRKAASASRCARTISCAISSACVSEKPRATRYAVTITMASARSVTGRLSTDARDSELSPRARWAGPARPAAASAARASAEAPGEEDASAGSARRTPTLTSTSRTVRTPSSASISRYQGYPSSATRMDTDFSIATRRPAREASEDERTLEKPPPPTRARFTTRARRRRWRRDIICLGCTHVSSDGKVLYHIPNLEFATAVPPDSRTRETRRVPRVPAVPTTTRPPSPSFPFPSPESQVHGVHLVPKQRQRR